MATPTVYGVTEGAGASATAHTITFTQTTGDRVVIFLANDSTARTWSLGDSFVNLTNTSATFHIFTKVLDGSEGGNMVATAGVATKSAWLAYNITTGTHASGTAPVFSTVATGTSTAPNSGSLSPSGGSATYLWLSAFGMAGEEADDDTWCNSAPSTPGTFTGLVQKTCGTAGAVTLNCEVAAAQYASETATVDPGAFDTDQSLAWRAYTVAIYPATAVFKEVYPGCASGTGAAYQPVPKPAPSAGHAAGTGTAYEPSRYAMALLALGPVAYWRLGESGSESSSYSTVVQDTANLVSYWRLNEASPGTGTAVDAMGARNGTYVGSPTGGVTGAILNDTDKAVTFAQATSVVTAVNATWPANWTLEGWMYPTTLSPGAVSCILSQGDGSANGVLFGMDNGLVVAYLGTARDVSDAYLTLNAWNYLVCTFDGTYVRAYLNGGLVLGPTSASYSTPGGIFGVVGRGDVNWGPTGTVDELAFYNRALTADEVRAHFVAAGHAVDASGNGHNGIYVNTPTLGVTGLLTGDSDTAMTVNGTDELVTVGAPVTTATDNWTLVAWMKVPTLGTYACPILVGHGSIEGVPYNGYAIYINTTGNPVLTYPGVTTHTSTTVLTPGSTVFVVGLRRSGTDYIYIDGMLDLTGDTSAPITPTLQTLVGSYSNTGAFGAATVDEVAVWTRALSAAEVFALYVVGRRAAAAGHASGTGAAYAPTISTGKSVDAGLAAATGAAYSPPIKYAPVGLASGVGAANAPPAKVAPNAAHAPGTGSAYQPVANPKPNAGVAAATGSAYGPPIKYVPAGLASGTGAAYGPTLTCASNANAGHAAGTGAAYGPPIKYVLAGHAAATGAAYGPTPTCASNAPAGHASGTGAAYGPPIKYVLAGLAAGAGAAFGASETVAPNAGSAAGTGDAYQPTVDTGGAAKSVYPDCAAATGDAYAASTKVNVNVEGGATGTGAAGSPTATVAPSAGAVAGTGSAYGPTLTCASNANAGHAAGTGAAYNPPFGAPAGLASGTGSAYQPTLTILSNAPAGHAAGTGAAFGASEKVTPNAGHAAATGSAYGPPIKYVLAGLASGTGAAATPAAALSPNVGVGAATGAAGAPIAALGPSAGHAAGTGAAADTGKTVIPNAGLAEGTGSAYEPTVSTSSGGTFAPAGCAEGTGAAYEPTVTASPSVFAWCDAATGTGAAYGATLPTISGVTRDENGSAIPLCTVDAFVSSTNAYYATTTSDALGRYSIIVTPGVDYFLVAYTLVGDVYGVTARDLSA